MMDGIVFFGVIALLSFLGVKRSRSVQSESAYLYAERRSGIFALTCTLIMTELNPATLIAFSSIGYLVGSWALTLPLVFLIGLLFYAISVAKKWKELDGYSVTDLFRKRYGKTISQLSSISLILSMIGFSAAYVKSMTMIFTPFLPNMNPWLLSGMILCITLLMTLRGGLFAIIRTDIGSFFLTIILFPLLLFFTWKGVSTEPVTTFPEAQTILPPRFITSLIALTMFTYILAPWYGQKIFSAKTKKVAYSSVLLAAIGVFAIYSVGVLVASFVKRSGLILSSHEMALPSAIHSFLPIGLKGLAYATLFTAGSTTLAGVWNALSSMATNDFGTRKENASHQTSLLWTVCFASLSFILGNTLVDRVLDKLILANIPTLALSFALLAGFYWKRATPLAATFSIFTGLIWGTFCYFFFGEEGMYTWYWAMGGIPLIFGVGIITSIFTEATYKQKLLSQRFH